MIDILEIRKVSGNQYYFKGLAQGAEGPGDALLPLGHSADIALRPGRTEIISETLTTIAVDDTQGMALCPTRRLGEKLFPSFDISLRIDGSDEELTVVHSGIVRRIGIEHIVLIE